MPRVARSTIGMTDAEWRDVPVTFGSDVAARLFCTTPRNCTIHGEELGGTLVCGRWVFSKQKVAEILGLSVPTSVCEQ